MQNTLLGGKDEYKAFSVLKNGLKPGSAVVACEGPDSKYFRL